MNATDLLQSRITFLEQELAAERAKNEKLRKRLESHEPALLSELEARIENSESALATEKEKTAKLEVFIEASGNVLAEWGKKLQESESGAAALREGFSQWKNGYESGLEHAEKRKAECEKEGDSHGKCFFEGMWSGLVNHDLSLGALKRAMQSTAGASLLARLAELEALVAGLEQDRERLNYVEELIRNCPHAEITFNDDSDMDELLGFIIRVEGCETSESVGITFREAIDQDRAAEIERRKA